ncbi:MAG: YceH family protein [Acidobacteria bacterium]|nr:YceH family protein [Acidobacteriota bacterium]MBK9528546.1 YceH family protein [Acidobacteriota bacterium]MBP7475389.1 YceH family protein [Pyrinomonadaceae bacterium]
MLEQLNENEARILGSLVEKQLTTPEYYPLTLNALVNACNQKNNREPVMSLGESAVSTSVEHLRDRNLIYVFYGSTSRVPKYKHMLPSVYELEPSETAVMAVLLLRGPQTLGELRTRTERMHEFQGLGEVQETLDGLSRRDEPLVVKLPVLPGQKEARFAHTLSGEIDIEALAAAHPTRTAVAGASADRIAKLEEEVTALREEVESLKSTFDEFRKQFE